MAIYAYQNTITSSTDYLKEVTETDYIDGFVLHITMTKDNQIIIYTKETPNFSLEKLQNSNFQELENTSAIKLQNFLTMLPNIKKRIILYVTPLITAPLSEETLDQINARNWLYIETIKNILLPFQNILIRLASRSRRLVTYMQQQINFMEIGWILSPLDLNYQEVDFFILPTTLLNSQIIRQQLLQKIAIFVEVLDANDLSLLYQFFGEKENNQNMDLFEKMEFIVAYPTLFYSLFKEKGLLK